MKKTIAQKHVREFEKLVLEYLKDAYHITDENFASLTPPTKDGGYDGVIYWFQNVDNPIMKETIFEAKLRNALGQALPLNDFSKALIIAINRFSDEVYIATNISFSAETIHNLEVFAKRTDISIKTLNGKILYNWFQKYSSQNTLTFKDEFIDFMEKSAKKIESTPSIDVDSYNKKQTALFYAKDYTRRKSIEDLLNLIIAKKRGTVLIEGNRGSGKSRLSIEIKDKLENIGYITADIDLKYTSTSRTIFLSLLQIIWFISIDLNIDYSEEELDIIFSKIGGKTLASDKKKCFKQIFQKDIEEYTGHWDIYQLYLMELLDTLFSHYTQKANYCIHIHNLDAGYYENCLFVLKIISKLQECPILFLIELRDDYNGDSNISSNEWNDIYTKLTNLSSIIKRYQVNKLSETEKEEYIAMKLERLSKHQVNLLKKEVSDNPLILNTTLEMLASEISFQNLLDIEFESRLEFFKRTYENEIVRQSIRYKIRLGGSEKLTMPLVMISLLNGKCSIACIQRIIKYDKEQLIKDFLDMGMFYVQNDIIVIKHELYLNSLHNYSDYVSLSSLQELAKMMLEEINIFYNDALQKELLRLKLLKILEQKNLFVKLSCEIGQLLLKQGDLHQALNVYESGYKVLENIEFNGIKAQLIELEILKKLLYIHANSKGDHTSNMQILLGRFHLLIEKNRRILRHSIAYVDSCLNELIYEMKSLHKSSKHSECLTCAYKARRLARKVNLYDKHPETMEQILWLKSLSVKHISGIQACMQSFESDIIKNPNLPLLMYSYNTHKTATLSRKNPRFALNYFKANEKYYTSLSMADQLHNRVNIANMHFFLREYDISINLAKNIIGDAITYDIKTELGRIYNLVGNYYAIFNDMEQGMLFYKKAIEIFEEMKHLIHLWSPLVNISSLYLENKDYSNALKCLEKAINIIKIRKNELRGDANKSANEGSKLYIGIIIILHNLHEVSPHIERADIMYKNLTEELKQYISSDICKMIASPNEYKDFFENSSYEHNQKIILKV